ncbi:Mobile element protein [Streptococcus oralis]|uniref:Mobile element protein n=1 Tax=Streptococcus oralis TaxID=1303 RepID=A0A139P4U1_STROR|nr:Mobile element protein [Streptococcus oralis]
MKGGQTAKMSLEDILIATLQYLREYRTYEQIVADSDVHKSNLIRRSYWVEEVLVPNGFTIGKTNIKDTDTVII